MSSRTKSGAYRSGYRRALRDVEMEMDRIMDACVLVEKFARPEAGAIQRMREIVCNVRDRTTWRLKLELDENGGAR